MSIALQAMIYFRKNKNKKNNSVKNKVQDKVTEICDKVPRDASLQTSVDRMESNLNRVLTHGVHHQLSGQLHKYTNVMKGWQYRWFTVDPQTGTLSYYLYDSSDDVMPPPHAKASAPRGQVHLGGAVVYPSDEDSRTFSIGCASGDTLKLRAADARARQEWVNGLRAVVESYTKAMDINSLPLPPRELLAASDAMVAARQALFLTEQCNASLSRAVENIECSALAPTDPDLLLLKAISNASTQSLHQCLSLLQRHEETSSGQTTSAPTEVFNVLTNTTQSAVC